MALSLRWKLTTVKIRCPVAPNPSNPSSNPDPTKEVICDKERLGRVVHN